MLSDFAIAKYYDVLEATHLTSTGMAIGTPVCIAPELSFNQI